ncbi:MAG: hypothetical protein WEC59_13500 [Salibacteraceae bacterium]
MYGLSYVWHGIVLNDFLKISYPKDVFLVISAIVYFVIAFAITLLTYVLKKIKDSFKYGIAIGAAAGVFIYAIAFLLGVSFNATIDLKMIAFDLGWQTFEQGFGGLICGWTYRVMYLREKRLSH